MPPADLMATPRFTPRLRLALFLPTLLALLVGMPLVWALARGLIHEAAEENLRGTLAIVEAALGATTSGPRDRLDARARTLAEDSAVRITVIDSEGRVLTDTDRTPEQVRSMDNHRSRPEIRGAIDEGTGTSVRHSSTLGRDFVYVAGRVTNAEGAVLYLRLARPLAASAVLGRQLSLAVLLASLASLVAMAAISLWLNRQLFTPLARLVNAAKELADGALDRRVEEPDSQEVASLARALNQLADSVATQLQRAESERERLQIVSDSMVDGVLVTDSNGSVLTVNPNLRKLFRVSGDVRGASVLELTGEDAIESAIRKTLDTGESATLEVELPDSRTLSVTCSTLRDRSGGVVAVRDISELLLLGQIRRDLVANVSHELRTPLTAIRGYTETLIDGALDDRETASRFTRRILQQCERLQAILDDLLTLSRLEAGDSTQEAETVDLARVVEDAVDVLEPLASSKDVGLDVVVESAVFQGFPGTLTELCLNLIDNAIKYNRQGGRVDVRLARGVRSLELTISDTGLGIPAAAQARIFERFYRVDRGRSRAEGGTGLGLAIVKHAVEQHGGSISVESALGRGTTFRVHLPATESKPAG